jgi:23S rRNA pseudouridine1911/1915/1917 synthase
MIDNKHTRTTVKASAGENWAEKRLDAFWAEQLQEHGVSRERVKELIRQGLAAVNGVAQTKPNFRLAAGDELVLELPDEGSTLEADPGELEALYSDERVAVVHKPAGMTTHPAPSVDEPTLVNRLLHHFPKLAEMDGERPGVAHRLDKETSGVMVAALDEPARLALSRAFAERDTLKVYLALLRGRPPEDHGRTEAPIGRDPRSKTRMAVQRRNGRPAVSRWRTVAVSPDGRSSLVVVRILTGRTHQIRVHMAHLGCPVAGDLLYGDPAGGPVPGRMMLHALHLGFPHPESGDFLRFTAWPGEDFLRPLEEAFCAPLRLGLTGMPGCGKSTLASRLAEAGVPVFNADAAVAELYQPGGDGAHMLRARYGERFLDASGGVDKPALFQAMQGDDALRREVMRMVHPMVEARHEAFAAEHRAADWIVSEVPLLIEGGWDRRGLVDVVAGVHAPESLRKGDFARARQTPPETLDVLDSWQYPEEVKLKACQLAVENAGDLEELDQRARALQGVADWIVDRRRRRRMRGIMDGVRAGLEELTAS